MQRKIRFLIQGSIESRPAPFLVATDTNSADLYRLPPNGAGP
jgi:hypothetical protein